MDVADIFASLIIALGLGLLVGLQRERTKSRLGGIRTFGLVTLLGALCALLTLQPVDLGGWVVGAGMLALAAVIVSENRATGSGAEASSGSGGSGGS
ncbi:MAG: MgtC/SapB family protein [Planctomycetota bacterium]